MAIMRSLAFFLVVALVATTVVASTETGEKVHEAGKKTADHAAAATDAAAETANQAGDHASSWTGWAKDKINNLADSASKAAKEQYESVKDIGMKSHEYGNHKAHEASATAGDVSKKAYDEAASTKESVTGTASAYWKGLGHRFNTIKDSLSKFTQGTYESGKDAAGKTTDAAKDTAAKATDATYDAAGKATGAVKSTADKATDATSDAAGKAKDTAADATGKTSDAAKGAYDSSKDTVGGTAEYAKDSAAKATAATGQTLKDVAGEGHEEL